MKPFCKTCGRVFEHGIEIEGRFCGECNQFRGYEHFPRRFGMCDICLDKRRERAKEKRAAYFKSYYERVTKIKRRENSAYRVRTEKLNEEIDAMKRREREVERERKRRAKENND
jgi:hypothetical protein